jgi:DNA-binding beta-propeller fold protein YncE
VNTSTPTLAGHAPYTYRIEGDWAKLPADWVLRDVAAVAVDRHDRVYVFNRGTHPMVVFDRDGNVVDAWGDGIFTRPHGLQIGPDDTLYCTDDGAHVVRKCTLEGKVLLEIGVPGQPSPFMSGRPFNRCTHTALSPDDDIYVSDGYGNAAVHKFSPRGDHLRSWGECGTDEGQFNTPHNIVCDRDGWVYVADRENHRVQVFAGDGTYETQWNNLHRPCALALSSDDSACYVGELGTFMAANRDFPNIGPRISIVGKDGKVVSRVDERAGLPKGQFIAPHGIAIDSHGDVYVGEVSWTVWATYLHPGEERPANLRSLQKLVRTSE